MGLGRSIVAAAFRIIWTILFTSTVGFYLGVTNNLGWHYGWCGTRNIPYWSFYVVMFLPFYFLHRSRMVSIFNSLGRAFGQCLIFWIAIAFGLSWHQRDGLDEPVILFLAVPANLLIILIAGLVRVLVRPRKPIGLPICQSCGYELFGVSILRCPECGQPFSLDALGITADQLWPIGTTRPARN
ncbi:MAG TPA: hypothetical protein VG711_01160 [Phycisphaerales bacterium]|nr:hypothetical protein [Phycisphaerales bacterium]